MYLPLLIIIGRPAYNCKITRIFAILILVSCTITIYYVCMRKITVRVLLFMVVAIETEIMGQNRRAFLMLFFYCIMYYSSYRRMLSILGLMLKHK